MIYTRIYKKSMHTACKQTFSPVLGPLKRFAFFAKKHDEKKVEAPAIEEVSIVGLRDFNHLKKQVEEAKKIVRKKLIEIGREAGVPIPKQALMVYIRHKLLYEAKLAQEVKEKVKVLFHSLDQLDKALEDRRVAEKELRENLNSYAEKINEVISGFEKHKVEEYEEKKKAWEKKQEKRRWDPLAGFEEIPYEKPEVAAKVAFTVREKGPEEDITREKKKEEEFERAERIKKGGPEVLAQEMFRLILEGPRADALDATQLDAPPVLLNRFQRYAKSLSKGEILSFDGFTVYVTPSVDGNAVKFEWEGKQHDATISEHTVVRLTSKAPENPVFRERAVSPEKLAKEEKVREFRAALKGLMNPETPAGTRIYVTYREFRAFRPTMEKREVMVRKMYVKQHMLAYRADQYRVYMKMTEADGTPVKRYEKYREDTAYNVRGTQLTQVSSEVPAEAVIAGPRPSKSPERMVRFMRKAFKKALDQLTISSYAMRLFGQRKGPGGDAAISGYDKALKGLRQTMALYGVEDPVVRRRLARAGIKLPEPGSIGSVSFRVAQKNIPEQTLEVRLPSRPPEGLA